MAPGIPFDDLKTQKLLFAATIGFFAHREKFINEDEIKKYEKYAFSQKKKLLPRIFEEDLVAGLAVYANGGKITVKNIE